MLPRDAAPPAIRRLDYRPPAFLIDTVDLSFDLHPEATRVTATLAFRRNPDAHAIDRDAPLVLDGEQQRDVTVALEGTVLDPSRYQLSEQTLTIHRPAERRPVDRRRDDQPGGQRRAGGAVPVVGHVLHAVRGRGLPRGSPTSSTART